MTRLLALLPMLLLLAPGCVDMPDLPPPGVQEQGPTTRPDAAEPAADEPAEAQAEPEQPAAPRGRLLRQRTRGTAYQLYLPDGYKADRQWPIVLLADTVARRDTSATPGAIDEVWQIRADKGGWVVIGMTIDAAGDGRPALDVARVDAVNAHVLGRWSVDRSRQHLVPLPGAEEPVRQLTQLRPNRYIIGVPAE